MAIELLWKGLLIGLIFGVPAGAIGALSIQRTIERGFWTDLLTGMGSSVADLLYACIGVFGITLVTDFLKNYENPISMIGAGLIILYGILIFEKKAVIERGDQQDSVVLTGSFFSAFLIAISNPATIASFFVAFSTFGIMGPYDLNEGMVLVLGVLIGTTIWWVLLCGIVSIFKKHISDRIYGKMNHILGVLMILFGIVMLGRVLG